MVDDLGSNPSSCHFAVEPCPLWHGIPVGTRRLPYFHILSTSFHSDGFNPTLDLVIPGCTCLFCWFPRGSEPSVAFTAPRAASDRPQKFDKYGFQKFPELGLQRFSDQFVSKDSFKFIFFSESDGLIMFDLIHFRDISPDIPPYALMNSKATQGIEGHHESSRNRGTFRRCRKGMGIYICSVRWG